LLSTSKVVILKKLIERGQQNLNKIKLGIIR